MRAFQGYFYKAFPYTAMLGFIALVSFYMVLEMENFIELTFLFLAAGFTIYLLFFKKESLVWLCFLLVPLSVPFDMAEGATRLSFPSELIMVLLAMVFLLAGILRPAFDKKILLHPLTLLLIFDFFWMMVASCYSTMPIVSIKRLVIRMAFFLFFYLFMAHWFRKPKNMVLPMLLYAVGTLPVILFTLYKHALLDFLPQVTFNICQPFYPDHTVYGASLAFVIPFLLVLCFNHRTFGFSRTGQLLVAAVLVAIAAGLSFAFSRAALLSLLAALVFYGLMRLRVRFGWGMVLLSLGLAAGYTQKEWVYEKISQNESISNKGDISDHFKSIGNIRTDASNLERINRWICAYKMFKDRPVTGFGPGTYQFKYGQYQSHDQLTYISTFSGNRGNAHSEYFTYLSETGFPGLLIFLFVVFYSLFLGLKIYYTSDNIVVQKMAMAAVLGLVTFFVHGLVNAFIDQDKIAALVFPALAVLVALDVYHKKSSGSLSGSGIINGHDGL